jgi:hypothetical protein
MSYKMNIRKHPSSLRRTLCNKQINTTTHLSYHWDDYEMSTITVDLHSPPTNTSQQCTFTRQLYAEQTFDFEFFELTYDVNVTSACYKKGHYIYFSYMRYILF